MKAAVALYYKNGICLGSNHKLKFQEGNVSLHHAIHPMLKRATATAYLFDANGRELLELNDVVILSAEYLMRWRGLEYGPNAREQAQEWWIRPMPEERKDYERG